ncbi:sulfonate ABC transporter substrate-binding protein [Pantanalinema sp. GBBB05]|uniref:sulfonate ABC transporter substrate-binding protein n=1 Tax=Pantanalinema sp. GBBB05 TaxID=2604139 RepID=UPI001DBD8EB3|nr:sulfonate ABC transporter substrate-binding protein [Pantanalinema sp. GBBB05]
MKRRDVLLGLTSFSVPIVVASCTNNSGTSTSATTGQPSAAPVASSSTSSGGTVRFGYQKASILLKSQGNLEKRLNAEGVQVEWKEFPAGPPLLEALNAGAIDIGPVGESPPIFAQAAGADLIYAASVAPNPKGSGVLVLQDSSIQTVADLKGKKVTFAKGSSANYLIVQLLEQAGLQYSDIQPVYLTPADARAAFVQGNADAWVIWDPFFAAAETGIKSRVIANGEGLNRLGGYYIASRQFATERPKILKAILEEVRDLEAWSDQHRDQVAAVLTTALKLDATAVKTATQRRQFGLKPVTEELIAEQQKVADVYYQLKLIPKPIRIQDTVLPPEQVAAYALS